MGIAKALGYSENGKLLMIHADDAGLSHSENIATMQSLEKGSVNSYSVMVPCKWFNEMAEFAIDNPQFDNGIHLTLTCEWENYRFGPILGIKEVPSLVDENGHFYKKRELLHKYATNEEVRKELQAQIEKALGFGMKPTHLDSHMYSVAARPDFIEIYRDLGRIYNLPVFFNRQLINDMGLDAEQVLFDDDLVADNLFLGSYADFEKGRLSEYYKQLLDNLPIGFNVLILHPAFDDLEMQGITMNHPNFRAEWRQTDYEYFTSEACKIQIRENNIKLITWNEIRQRFIARNQ
ncbi:MAG TPA: ChbG/HpnK family deacetylase [Pricia antarctica]|uniref:ChbG/HpnK family deacetylase n=2 Tax=root TaxID=1 RepID=A0A831QRZ9_9FLAO|nr:ChbG/HpnK family deacetylase [Pricia antarctica]